MNQELMTLDFWQDTVIYEGKTFPVGTLAFTTTCDWCVYNRIFVSRTAEWGEMEEGVLDMSTCYYEANPASVLLDNINAARQTWNYG